MNVQRIPLLNSDATHSIKHYQPIKYTPVPLQTNPNFIHKIQTATKDSSQPIYGKKFWSHLIGLAIYPMEWSYFNIDFVLMYVSEFNVTICITRRSFTDRLSLVLV